MNVLVVGAGGREHALALALSEEADVVVAPGNPGMAARPGRAWSATASGTLSFAVDAAESLDADLVVIGPEAPLVAGLADRLRARGRRVLGPGASGARLEGSKAWAKRLMARQGVPTARATVFSDLPSALAHLEATPGPWVVKADGLTAGKGVLVTAERAEAAADVRAKLSGEAFADAGRVVLIEEAMQGPELSVLALCDGRRCVLLPSARDAKRLGDGDTGPNTGGMGAFAPVPDATAELLGRVMDEVLEPTLAGLRAEGIDYRGIIYAGMMLTDAGPRVVEFNVRLGDPEAQAVLPLLGGVTAELFAQAADGRLLEEPPDAAGAAVCLVLAAPGYPAAPLGGGLVCGVEQAEAEVPGVRVLQAGTALDRSGRLVAAGGRVLDVVARAGDLYSARRRAYEAMERLRLPGGQVRRDLVPLATEARPAFPAGTGTSAEEARPAGAGNALQDRGGGT